MGRSLGWVMPDCDVLCTREGAQATHEQVKSCGARIVVEDVVEASRLAAQFVPIGSSLSDNPICLQLFLEFCFGSGLSLLGATARRLFLHAYKCGLPDS